MTPAQRFRTRSVGENIWAMDGASNDLMYLVVGQTSALLVDTGLGIGDLSALVKGMTDLPVMVVNTHGHPDHAGGNAAFPEVRISPADIPIMQRMASRAYRAQDIQAACRAAGGDADRLISALVPDRSYRVRHLEVGQRIDLGGRVYEVVGIPGHTPGSIGLLNSAEKHLFSGDAIVATPVWLYLEHSLPLQDYYQALRRLQSRAVEFTRIFPGHEPTPLGTDILDELIECCRQVILDPGRGEPMKTFAGQGLLWQYNQARVIYDPQKV